jgi:hypothetical protein
MQKILTLVLFFACSTLSFSQSITLKGKVTAPDDFPLESATIYLTSVKDSTVVEYTISDKNGNWSLNARKTNNPMVLKASFVGFGDYKKDLPNGLSDNQDFGTLKLSDKATTLNEVVIEGEAPPVRIKKDTLEFNASSFKVRPDANVEALLKQLPGVVIDEDGKITVNGKEVNQILVNGKPFFDKDGKIALQNLPADIINKVQVTDTKTKKEELSGKKASGDNASINLTIDEDKNKGYFGKVMGGYGSDDRYETSALANYFKGKTKLSLLASSNNINTTGFSMNEIFDSMGGGRNVSMYNGSNGSFNINGVQFGNSSGGITQTDIVGLNYADEWTKGFDGTASYFYTGANNKNSNKTNQTNYLPLETDGTDNSYTTSSKSNSTSDQYAHNFASEFNIKADSTATFYIAPKFTAANSKSSNDFTQNSKRLSTDRLLNDSEGTTASENQNNTFSNNLVFNKVFKKKGRSIDVTFENENRKDDGTNYNNSITNQYTYDSNGNQTVSVDNRNQIRYNRQTSDNYTAGFEYFEPVTDSMEIKIGTNYIINKSVNNRDGYDFDEATGGYTKYSDSLSNYLTSKTNTLRPSAGFNINKEKINFSVSAGPQLSTFDNYSFYLGKDYSFKKDYVLPYIQANGNFRMSKSKSLNFWYSYDSNFPQASQVLPVEDVSNPLYTTIGNPNLDPSMTHNFGINFHNYDFASRSGYSFYIGGNVYEDNVINYTIISESAKRTTTYKNVNGTYYSWFGVNWNKSIKREANSYRINLGLSGNYEKSKGFANTEMYDSKQITFTPRLSFTYEYGELLTINPSYNLSYTQANYTNYTVSETSKVVHRFNLQTTSYWPKHVVFGNDFGYTYNSQLGDGFKKDFYLWNTSLGYNFLDDKFLFKVKVYDLLNQNTGTSRSISATGIYDTENVVLKRYVMFSLMFKLDKFGGKKGPGGRGGRMPMPR